MALVELKDIHIFTYFETTINCQCLLFILYVCSRAFSEPLYVLGFFIQGFVEAWKELCITESLKYTAIYVTF